MIASVVPITYVGPFDRICPGLATTDLKEVLFSVPDRNALACTRWIISNFSKFIPFSFKSITKRIRIFFEYCSKFFLVWRRY